MDEQQRAEKSLRETKIKIKSAQSDCNLFLKQVEKECLNFNEVARQLQTGDLLPHREIKYKKCFAEDEDVPLKANSTFIPLDNPLESKQDWNKTRELAEDSLQQMIDKLGQKSRPTTALRSTENVPVQELLSESLLGENPPPGSGEVFKAIRGMFDFIS